MTPAERLRSARRAAGYRSAAAAARAMGMAVATYTQHENGKRGLSAQAQDRYLAFFGITPHALSPRAASGHPGAA
jgi:transcriptional regulator with XRE-family HTH domain